jgi:sec-independent protein translocase protein TatB
MFDINWSELLILAVVALIVVGPKELPVLLRTLGRYAGMARRQAAEFRSHFDDAMREAEMAELREEMESVRREVMASTRDIEKAASEPQKSVEDAALQASKSEPRSPAGAPKES